jgi:fucose permease
MAPFKHEHVQDSVKVLQSKAHEDDQVPGTVYLQPTQSGATVYGQAIFPVPSADPNDSLLWPQWRKLLVLCVVCFYSIIGNGTGLAPSVYIEVFACYFSVSPARSSNIASYGILAYGVSNLIWVPLSIKFGRRATWLISLVFYLVL